MEDGNDILCGVLKAHSLAIDLLKLKKVRGVRGLYRGEHVYVMNRRAVKDVNLPRQIAFSTF